jgi:hypothetical protein
MRKLAFAVLAAMSVGACATAGNGNGASSARVAAGKAQYCWADRMEAIGSRYNCNWAATKEEACAGNGAFSTVDGTGYAYPRANATCAGGQRLIELVPKA